MGIEDRAILVLLLERGSRVDVRSDDGATLSMFAVEAENLDQATFLLDHRADIHARDKRGFTASHRAAEFCQLEIAEILLERGASPNSETAGHTPRSLADASGGADMVALLTEYGDSGT